MTIPLKPAAHRLNRDGRPGRAESRYEVFAPSSADAAVAVECTWQGRAVWPRRFRLLPDGCVDLIWDGETLSALKAADVALGARLHHDSRTVGVRLRPGAGGGLLGLSIVALPHAPVRLTRILGPLAIDTEARLARTSHQDEQRRLLERMVIDRINDGGRPDPQVVEAAWRLTSPETSVAAVARDTGLGGRELRRRFASHAGLGPKRLQRIFRFGGLVRRLDDLADGRVSAAALAIDLGYADQAHMTREARRISGSSPGGLVRTWSA